MTTASGEASVSQVDAVDVICGLLEGMPEVRAIQLVTVPRAGKMQTRLEDPDKHSELIEAALRLREDLSAPFWDSLMLACEHTPTGLPDEIAQAALFHQDPLQLATNRHANDDSVGEWLRERIESTPSEEVLALASAVTLDDGSVAHLPMLDFASRVQNHGAFASAVAVSRVLPYQFSLLASGRSYHYYGQALLSPAEHREFLGKALLFAPLVDHRWVAHQLMMGFTALRISVGRDGRLPSLVA